MWCPFSLCICRCQNHISRLVLFDFLWAFQSFPIARLMLGLYCFVSMFGIRQSSLIAWKFSDLIIRLIRDKRFSEILAPQKWDIDRDGFLWQQKVLLYYSAAYCAACEEKRLIGQTSIEWRPQRYPCSHSTQHREFFDFFHYTGKSCFIFMIR